MQIEHLSGVEKNLWLQIGGYLAEKLTYPTAVKLVRKGILSAQKYLKEIHETSYSRYWIVKNTILPRAVIYKILKESGYDADALMTEYMKRNAEPSHAKLLKLEQLPFFYELFSTGFILLVKHCDAWASETESEQHFSAGTIHKCLWHEICIQIDCPEACAYFCKSDEYAYSNLKKIGFHRTQTLGTGGNCCDFVFYRRKD